jgi:hypothetical protein
VPNGGSPIRPGPLIVGIMLAFATIAFPPLLLVAAPLGIAWIVGKLSARASRRRRHYANLEGYARYYAEWQSRQAPVTNPGWRL